MSSLDEIVDVTINVQAPTITRAGFGTPMIVGAHNVFLDRVRTYSTVAEMLTDGFHTDHPMIRLARAIKGQSPSVPRFKVGRREQAYQQDVEFTPGALNQGFVHAVTVVSPDGTETVVRHVNVSSETVDTLIAALLVQFNAISGITAERPVGGNVIFSKASAAGFAFDYKNVQGFAGVAPRNPDPGIAQDLAAIREADGDWYGFVIDNPSKAEVLEAAEWAESERVLFGASAFETAVLDPAQTTDVASQLKALGRRRTHLTWNGQLLSPAPAAWLSRMFTTDPGTANWSYKALAGVTADNLSTTQRAAIEAKNANHYTTVAGRNTTRYGRLPSGQFIDVTRYVDFLSARLQENIFGVLVSRPKVPYTDGGVDLITNEIRAQLRRGVDSGALSPTPEPTVTAPRVSDVSPVDRANRVLPDVKFTAQLAGAINKVRIEGTLVV